MEILCSFLGRHFAGKPVVASQDVGWLAFQVMGSWTRWQYHLVFDNDLFLYLAQFGPFRFNCVATVKLLIQRGANPAIASTNRSTALHFAARRGNHKVAELLLDHAKVDINEKDFAHMTALHLACVSGNIAISKMLLGRGADIRAKSTELMTPLHTAVYHGNAEVAALILRTGRYSRQA